VVYNTSQSGAKLPKLTTPKNDAFAIALSTNHKSFGYSEVLIYGSEMVLLGVVIGKCKIPSTDISQENEHANHVNL
jgi:hypothetical protein